MIGEIVLGMIEARLAWLRETLAMVVRAQG